MLYAHTHAMNNHTKQTNSTTRAKSTGLTHSRMNTEENLISKIDQTGINFQQLYGTINQQDFSNQYQTHNFSNQPISHNYSTNRHIHNERMDTYYQHPYPNDLKKRKLRKLDDSPNTSASDLHPFQQSSPKRIDSSFSAANKSKTLTSKFKSLSDKREQTMKPFKDYKNLQTEIKKHFPTTPISSAYIDSEYNLVIKTSTHKDQKQIESTTLISAFTSGLELIIKTPKFYVAIRNVDTDIDLDSTAYKEILRDNYGIVETKRMTARTGEKYKTIKAMTTDREKFEQILSEGQIKLFFSIQPIVKWNFNDGPDQCFKCLKFGHTHRTCNEEQLCLRCGGNHTKNDCKLKEGDPLTCANCKVKNLPHTHAAVSKSCPSIIARMNLRTKTTSTYVRKFSDAITSTPHKHNFPECSHALVKLANSNQTQMANLILLFIEMFKNINSVQDDLDKPDPTYTVDLLKHYLTDNLSNQVLDSLKAINKENLTDENHDL